VVNGFLVDTNTWIIYLKFPDSKIRRKLAGMAPSDIVVCSVVKAELWYGALKYGNPERRRAALVKLLSPYRSYPFADDSVEAYANLRHELDLRGQIIGPNDLMIAAIAQANGLTLVTHNTGEFGRVPNLKMENWVD
jgi:tRNA(fMet)-specific endonuclease VapC